MSSKPASFSASLATTFGSALVASLVCMSKPAYALSVRALANAGYEKITVDNDPAEDSDFSGYTVGALAGVGFLDSVPGFSLLALGGLRYETLEWKKDSLKQTIKPVLVSAEFGPEFSLIPLLRVQALVGYDLKLSGKTKSELKAGDPVVLRETDIKSFNRFNVTARALFTVAPTVSLGLEPSYHSGKFAADSDTKKEQNFSGYSIKAVAAFTL